MSESAFGVDHGDVSKAFGPVGLKGLLKPAPKHKGPSVAANAKVGFQAAKAGMAKPLIASGPRGTQMGAGAFNNRGKIGTAAAAGSTAGAGAGGYAYGRNDARRPNGQIK